MYPPHPKGIPPQAELHAHVGASVDSAILWSIAHQQGIKLPTKDFWEFDRSVTIFGHANPIHGMHDLDKMYHTTELIQSSPIAMEPMIKDIIGGGYRSNNIVLQELRYNPMKRNRGGERDLDHLILASIYGMERALLEYPMVRAGLILAMDRTFTLKQNSIILEKAKKYQHRGIVGIDIAGPQSNSFDIQTHRELFDEARRSGLGITIHTGEEGTVEEMAYIIEHIQPDRIGHGVLAASHPPVIKKLIEHNVTLEICPSSNLNIGILKNIEDVRRIIRTFIDAGVKITINTDGPEMHATNLTNEFKLLEEHSIVTDEEIAAMRQNAFDATFIKE